jgi:catechol 2,3-dioxygenase-like lactoylglutathione lyase family enzyme
MKVRLAHVSITAKDLRRLAAFYIEAFGFVPHREEKGFSGEWVEKGTGVPGADFTRIHLRLPGAKEHGTELEIIQYSKAAEDSAPPAANRTGLRHMAFQTENTGELASLYDRILEIGGGKLGEISEREIEGLGTVTFVYMTDPEGNIVELINWKL